MALSISAKGLEIIKKYEGLVLTAYKCPAGVWTIGYGHTSGVYAGMVINEAKAEEFLKADCSGAERAVNNYDGIYNWTQNQFDALVSFTFNCGAGNLDTLLAGGRRTIAEISEKISLYNKANGETLAGLVRRRAEEKALFDSGKASTSSAVKKDEEIYDMTMIRKGSTGKAVKIWQIIVGVEADGIFGSDTHRATVAFQQKKKLDQDGIVGPLTWRAGLESV